MHNRGCIKRLALWLIGRLIKILRFNVSERGRYLYHLCGGEFVLEEGIDVAGTLVVQAC